jgi:prevent-host-death family protein
MRTFGTFEARNHLSAILDLVEAAEEVTITRNGKQVAKLVPPERMPSQIARAQQAARQILEMRREVRPDPDGLTVRDYVEMGRRY